MTWMETDLDPLTPENQFTLMWKLFVSENYLGYYPYQNQRNKIAEDTILDPVIRIRVINEFKTAYPNAR